MSVSLKQERTRILLEKQATELLKQNGFDEWGVRIAEANKKKRQRWLYLKRIGIEPLSK